MWQGIEKRKFPRVRYLCKIVVFKKGQREKYSTYTENVGVGGVCVILDKAVDKFVLVEMVLYLEDNQPPLECNGRVVWVVERDGKFDIGIEFAELKKKDGLRIEKVVQECLKNSRISSNSQ